MGVDELKEAIEKGYLGGKYIVPKTLKITHEMLDGIIAASETYEQDSCSWVREVIAKALLAEDAKYERMARARERAKGTLGTLVHQQNKSPSVGADEPIVQNTLEGKEQ
jgi:hypothetical protein